MASLACTQRTKTHSCGKRIVRAASGPEILALKSIGPGALSCPPYVRVCGHRSHGRFPTCTVSPLLLWLVPHLWVALIAHGLAGW
jgi:hypothetical protein